ncbi:MAG: ATP-binding cassette domain-containing protein, partial [Thermoanaerobaculia bacterium]
MSAAPVAIEVRGVTVGYGERVIQQSLDFQVRRGEVFVILGGSGSGKSSVLKAMIGLNEPLAGQILFDGESLVAAEGEDRLRLLRKFGVMYQSGALFGSMTVLENVRLPLDEFTDLRREERDLIAMAKLNQVSLLAAAVLMPSELSGGMQKRAAIARALALDPELLFLDEPTAGLDPDSAGGVDELVRKLRDLFGLTIVMITHDLDLLWQVADRVAVLAEDKVQGIGTMSELSQMKHPEIRKFFD